MSSYNKAKGTRWESDIEEYINQSGLRARRLPRTGAKDIGDVAVELGKTVLVVEAKNRKSADMAQWLREADQEAANYEDKYNVTTVPCVITKTRGRGAFDGRVTMTLEDFLCLLKWNGLA